MALKTYKPTTPGQRGLVQVDRSALYSGKPVKKLTEGLNKSGGRNNAGRITARRRGGGHKRSYRIIDFKRQKFDMEATVERLEYDPNRSAFIALITYTDGEQAYIIAPQRLAAGDKVIAGESVDVKPGNAMPLKSIPIGTIIHNIELTPGRGAALARSAGSYAQLNARDGKYAIVKLPSGETRMILTSCMATIGSVSNSEFSLERSGKAGKTRWLGRRPRVRGVVMNPVDHPMGGGEGKSSGGHPRSRTGLPAKGFKTRSKTKASNKHIIERRKK